MKNKLSRQAAMSLLALGLIAGCKGNNPPPAGQETATQPPPAPPPAAATDTSHAGGAAAATLTDANIMALLDEANKADSSAGAMALKKATSPEVKTFAREMTIDHHKLRVAGDKLAKKLNITPAAPANDPLVAAAQDETSALESAKKGPEFDRTYIEKEVSVHQAVKDLLDQANGATQNEEIKNLIAKAKPIIQQHLDHAQALQKKLTRTA